MGASGYWRKPWLQSIPQKDGEHFLTWPQASNMVIQAMCFPKSVKCYEKPPDLNPSPQPQRSEPGAGALVFKRPDPVHMFQDGYDTQDQDGRTFFLLFISSQRACLYTKGSSDGCMWSAQDQGPEEKDLPWKEPFHAQAVSTLFCH